MQRAAGREQLAAIDNGAAPADPLFADVARIVRTHGLPLQLFRDLLDAFGQDVTKKRYALNVVAELDDPRDVAYWVGSYALLYGRKRPVSTG